MSSQFDDRPGSGTTSSPADATVVALQSMVNNPQLTDRQFREMAQRLLNTSAGAAPRPTGGNTSQWDAPWEPR